MAKSTKSKTKNQGGRPKVELTSEQIKEVELLAAYLPIERIADHLGISEKTFHNIKNRDEAVFTAYNRGVAKAHVHVGNTIMKFMQYDGEDTAQLQLKFQAAKFYAQTKASWGKEEKKINIDLPKDAKTAELVDIAIQKFCTGEISFQVAQQIADLAKLKYAMQNQPAASEAHNFFADIEEMHEMSRTFLEAHNLMEQIKVKQK